MNKLIVAVDLGHFKAYRVRKEPMESPRISLIESYDSLEGHARLSEQYSDKTGRFGNVKSRKGSTTGSGEPHNIELEKSKRITKLIARVINSLVAGDDCDGWHLAAGRKINGQIIDNLDPTVRARLEKKITANLTKVDRSEILEHFK